MSGGGSCLSFWKSEGAHLSRRPGRLGKRKPSAFLCSANLRTDQGWRLVVGTAGGDLYLYTEREAMSVSSSSSSKQLVGEGAHAGAVLCLAEVVMRDSGSSGGSCGGEEDVATHLVSRE